MELQDPCDFLGHRIVFCSQGLLVRFWRVADWRPVVRGTSRVRLKQLYPILQPSRAGRQLRAEWITKSQWGNRSSSQKKPLKKNMVGRHSGLLNMRDAESDPAREDMDVLYPFTCSLPCAPLPSQRKKGSLMQYIVSPAAKCVTWTIPELLAFKRQLVFEMVLASPSGAHGQLDDLIAPQKPGGSPWLITWAPPHHLPGYWRIPFLNLATIQGWLIGPQILSF